MTSNAEKSQLNFINADVGWNNTVLDKMEKLFEVFLQDISEGERVLVKVHFGQLGNTASMRPAYIRTVVDFIKRKGGIPALAETTGLGYGFGGKYAGRGTAGDYLNMAAKQGFTMGSMGAPIVILDGELGADTIRVDIDGKHIKRVEVARGLLHYDKIIVFSHAKGHPIGGIGGAIKNLGIGCVGKYSKGRAHYGDNPVKINAERCEGEVCGKCLMKCPVRCITLENNVAEINHKLCIKCGHCSSTCNEHLGRGKGAVTMGWIPDNAIQAERFAENASGVIKVLEGIPVYYINLLLDVSPMCDCVDHTPYLMTENIGILAGRDPLAIDKASVDLINIAPPMVPSPLSSLKPGEDKFGLAHAKKDKEGKVILSVSHEHQIQRAYEMGMGNLEYEITEL
ncbi:MAG: DUF362 domain-containing protein [Candidatus Odinarchaeota archaeon]